MSFLYPLFSWIVLEHHIHHFDILNAGMTRIERRSKLEERLQRTTSLKPQMIDIIMSRENGVWEAILCMNQGNCVEKISSFPLVSDSSIFEISFIIFNILKPSVNSNTKK